MASVASTYARAFADVVLGAHLDADRCIAELRTISTLLAESSELRRVWENPAIPAEQKRRVLDVIAERDGISMHARNLVAVLIDHRRIHFLDPIIRQLEKELDARLGFAEAEITSARELGAAEKREFEAQVGKLTGKKVRRAIRAGCVASGRRGGPRRQHDLRRFGKRAVGEDSGRNQRHLAIGN